MLSRARGLLIGVGGELAELPRMTLAQPAQLPDELNDRERTGCHERDEKESERRQVLDCFFGEAVTGAAHGLNAVAVFSHFLAKAFHMHIDRSVDDEGLAAPGAGEQLVA